MFLSRSVRLGALSACLLAGCGVLSLEEQVLQRFFEASRLYDRVALEKVATIAFHPVVEGIVLDFDVDGVDVVDGRRVVRLDAQVRQRNRTALERLVVTLELKDGRWLVTGLTRPRASQTSRGASSAPPY
jgi:hypothetical protein